MTVTAADNRKSTAESVHAAVSFSAILAGAVATASTGLVLALVGAGMGLVIATPWIGVASAATKFAASTAISLVVIEWLSSAVGGYITGRLRVQWVHVHDDEVFFHDTAHGILAWAVATLFAACLFAGAFTSALSGGTHLVAAAASSMGRETSNDATQALATPSGQVSYWADELLRAGQSPSAAGVSDARPEFARILLCGMTGEIPQADKDYLAQTISARTGVDAAEAKKRVDNVVRQIDEAKSSATELADSLRKVAATTSLMSALALAIGAFISSAAAGLGGRRRDE